MSKPIQRVGKGVKPLPRRVVEECRSVAAVETPVCLALSGLEDRCAALETLASGLEDRLGPVLYPGFTGSGTDGNDPEPVRSPVVDAIARCAERLNALHDRLTSLISRIEC